MVAEQSIKTSNIWFSICGVAARGENSQLIDNTEKNSTQCAVPTKIWFGTDNWFAITATSPI